MNRASYKRYDTDTYISTPTTTFTTPTPTDTPPELPRISYQPLDLPVEEEDYIELDTVPELPHELFQGENSPEEVVEIIETRNETPLKEAQKNISTPHTPKQDPMPDTSAAEHFNRWRQAVIDAEILQRKY